MPVHPKKKITLYIYIFRGGFFVVVVEGGGGGGAVLTTLADNMVE